MAMAGTQSKVTIWNKKFINIFIINFILSMGQYMMNTLIPKYAYYLGATAAVVGVVSSMFAVTALLIRPVAGPAMDYFRKSKLLAVATGILTLAFICYGFAGNIPLIIAARLIHGVGIGVAVPLCLAMASNALPSGKMASGISVYTLGAAVSTAVGPSLGLKLMEMFGYNVTFFIISALLVICFIFTLRLQSDLPDRTAHFKISLNKVIVPEVIIPTIIMFFLTVAYSCINYFIVIYGGIRGTANIGLFFTVYAVCLLISRPVSGRIADRYGMDKTVIPGMLLFGLSFVIISFSASLPMFLIAGTLCAFGYGICTPALQTLCMLLVTKERRGAAGNTNFIGIDCGNLTGPILAGVIITGVQHISASEVFGYVVMYRVMIVPIIIALIIFILNQKKMLQTIKRKND
jgi:MFS family permease